MSRYVFKLPDLGEGTVQAELVAWHVRPGDLVREDQVIAEVMTDKAAVEVPAPVSGRVLQVQGGPGDMIAVGSEFAVFETDANAAQAEAPVAAAPIAPASVVVAPAPTAVAVAAAAPTAAPGASAAGRIMASPATRRRAREAGVDLAAVSGSGPGGRIQRADLDALLSGTPSGAAAPRVAAAAGAEAGSEVEEIRLIGLRRQIAERMQRAVREAPHFSYVEEVDVTELESLRGHLNARRPAGAPSLTPLPFIALAVVKALRGFPQCNATFDAERNLILRHRAVHLGIATQTPDGLLVPVVRGAQALDLEALAAGIRRVADAARTRKAPREMLVGSTITLTSLGRLGGIASTPVLNLPEVAIVGVNRVVERPMVVNGQIAVRRMMNLSSSFDHRFVDGADAAGFIQAVRELLEHPATIFMQN